MGQTARLRLIRDWFIAGHSSCELRRHLDSRHLDSVPPRLQSETWWTIATFGRATLTQQPSPDLTYPAYVVGDADRNSENTRVAAVTGQRSGMTQLEDLLRQLLTSVESPALTPEVPAVEKLFQRLVTEIQSRPPPAMTELEQMMRSFLSEQRQRQRPSQRQRPARQDWSDVVCFSCGKSGHAATRCPNLNDSFPFMQPGWWAEKTPGGFIMIPPRVAMDRRWAENGG